MSTLSLVLYQDMRPKWGPVHFPIENLAETLNQALDTCRANDDQGFLEPENKAIEILQTLQKQQYFTENKGNYALALSLDYLRFQIYADDYDPNLVRWREEDETDPIVDFKIPSLNWEQYCHLREFLDNLD